MIGRRKERIVGSSEEGPRGFDDFEMRLGDMMRGERATLGKSLLDVQRELRIKAAYIAAIENCDPGTFDTPGFIAGYVRSYARYLRLDPDATFARFCEESGFTPAHGMSPSSSVSQSRKTQAKEAPAGAALAAGRDIFAEPSVAFTPAGGSVMSRIEPGAIGSVAVLVALIGAIGYGGFSVLREVQRVQLAPVDQSPVVLSDLDPVDAAAGLTPAGDASSRPVQTETATAGGSGVFAPPSNEALDRLYRPEPLDVPVLVARDAPISTLDPSSVGRFARAMTDEAAQPDRRIASADRAERQAAARIPAGSAPRAAEEGPTVPQVVADARPGVTLVAVRPAWVRVRAPDGTSIYETIMNAGDTYQVPVTEEPATVRIGESGAIYFAVNGKTYGPAGQDGAVTRKLALSVDNLTNSYSTAALASDSDLAKVVAELQSSTLTGPGLPPGTGRSDETH